tara:strand:- start:1877 stop:2857 length:981 start_codon:yes stop_codon:yes gene_type:complete
MKKENVNTLSQNATLVRLNTKHPSGVKSDSNLKEGLALDQEAMSESLHVAKYIFGRETNKYFRRIINQFRNNVYYPLTVPWDDNTSDYDTGKVLSGWRLCPNSQLDTLTDAVNDAKANFEKEVKHFLDVYPKLIESNKYKLGKAFNINDYPDVEEMRYKFRFDFELSSVPQFNNNDIRLNVSKSLQGKIERDAIKRANKNIEAIARTTVEALLDSVEHLVEKLNSYDPSNKSGNFFKNGSFDTIRKYLETLPSINKEILGNDKLISEAHQKLVKVFAKVNDVDSLREKSSYADSKRKEIAQGMQDSIDDLKGGFLDNIYGGKPNGK